jgi:atypical dual specificity phosphatase
LKVSTLDFTATPSQEKIKKAVDFILSHKEKDQTVYVHCKAGRTRSATVVVCYIMQARFRGGRYGVVLCFIG